MAASHRSPVPDLLFEDQQHQRVHEIAHLLEDPERVSAATPLHRLTVFVTYACNLACPYCKTIARSPEELAARPAKASVLDVDAFARLLDSHHGTPLRHLHFTGGEPTMMPGLAAMVRLARAAGVERISLTSNGTLAPRLYLELIAAGVDEIRISLDAAEPLLGRDLTQRRGAWQAAVRTLTALAELRRAGAPVFLIINTVVGTGNRRQLADIVRFFLSFGPDDLKLITEVDLKLTLGDFPEAPAVAAGLDALLAARPADTLPLLRRKLATVFARDAIGLETLAPRADWRCYIPLTERTVDGLHYYPCSVYLREGGAPLGDVTEPQALQRERTAAFVRRGDCLDDPICRRYCLACTRAYNVSANDAREPSARDEAIALPAKLAVEGPLRA